MQRGKNVAVVNALQIEAVYPTTVVIRFNYDAHTKVNLSVASYSVFTVATLRYVVILTLDLEYVYCIACDVMKRCIKFRDHRYGWSCIKL